MASFIGRARQLRTLHRELDRVRRTREEPGQCLIVRGRRRVGKSRLVEQLIREADVPSLFFTASRQGAERELALFAEAAARSTLPHAEMFSDVRPESWDAALRLLDGAVGDSPSVVVIDELPYLLADDPAFDAALQKHWDRTLSKRPMLLLLIGSDLSVMEALNAYDRPFHQRGRELVVPAFDPAETADQVSLPAPDAVDAYLVSGGLPLILDGWPRGTPVFDFLEEGLRNPTSPLIVSAERSLAAEFPAEAQAAQVLRAIGSGERTFSRIAAAAGGIQHMSLHRSLELLTSKRVVTGDLPVSTRSSKERRYRVADPYLRFWLRFVGPYLAEIERGRADVVMERLRASWSSWRGRAVEPVVREALEQILPDDRFGAARHVGGFWTRTNIPEVDLVGVDREPVAASVEFVGSIRWRDNGAFDDGDVARLAHDRLLVPGAHERTPLVGVSRTGFDCSGLTVRLTPDDLLDAWRADDD